MSHSAHCNRVNFANAYDLHIAVMSLSVNIFYMHIASFSLAVNMYCALYSYPLLKVRGVLLNKPNCAYIWQPSSSVRLRD